MLHSGSVVTITGPTWAVALAVVLIFIGAGASAWAIGIELTDWRPPRHDTRSVALSKALGITLNQARALRRSTAALDDQLRAAFYKAFAELDHEDDQ